MEGNTPAATYEAQLDGRAAQLLPGIGLEERLELINAMDEGELRACLEWLAAQHPRLFDHALVRDEDLVRRLVERLDEADSDEDDLQPYCTACGADVGIFITRGDAWIHYRGDGTAGSPVEMYDAGHEPAVAWRENGRYACCRHCTHQDMNIPAGRHTYPCHDGCNDGQPGAPGAQAPASRLLWAKSPDGTRWTAFLPDGRMAVVERLGDGESFLPRISAFGKTEQEATGPVSGSMAAAARWCGEFGGAL